MWIVLFSEVPHLTTLTPASEYLMHSNAAISDTHVQSGFFRASLITYPAAPTHPAPTTTNSGISCKTMRIKLADSLAPTEDSGESRSRTVVQKLCRGRRETE